MAKIKCGKVKKREENQLAYSTWVGLADLSEKTEKLGIMLGAHDHPLKL